MARFASESVDRVRQAADIVEIVSAHTDLRQQGGRWLGLCPFHEERTPSFSVNPADKLYYCFGCEAGGDVFRFVQEKEGVEFPEAVEILAERYGVELEREQEDPRSEARRKRRDRLRELLKRTAAFYASYFWESKEAAKARDYLAERGLSDEVLREFGIGYAPSAWDQVLTRGQRAGFSVDDLRAAGLVQKGRGGGVYDRFRERITFPVRDDRGNVIGFGARAMRSEQGAKYVNSAEGELYRKSETLYGIDLAKGAIAKAGRAVVAEGYTDVLALHQAGITEAVGVMGTAITEEQVKMLSGRVEEVVLALDADRAGQDAMLRAQRKAAGRRMRIRVAAMPEGEDPAQMIAEEGGADRFRELVEGALELPEFQVGLVLDTADTSSPAERDQALSEVAAVLAEMGESVSREELVRSVAGRLDIDPAMVIGRIATARDRVEVGGGGGAAGTAAGTPADATLTPRERRERALLAMCIADRELGREMLGRLAPEHLSSPLAVQALEWLRAHLDDPLAGLPREQDQLVALITQLVMASEREPASAEAMEMNFLQLEHRRIEDRIAEAEGKGEAERSAELRRERAAVGEKIMRPERWGKPGESEAA
jgi:DNA primase